MKQKNNPVDWRSTKPGTTSVWAGETEQSPYGATQVPVVHGVTFAYSDVEEWMKVARGAKEGHICGRNANPTVKGFEEKSRAVEGAEAGTSLATGMPAVSNALFTVLSPGQRVVSIKDA